MSATVLVSTFAPFSTLCLSLPASTSFDSLYDVLAAKYPALPAGLRLSHPTRIPEPLAPLSSLTNDLSHPISLRLAPGLLGGKGGFGSQLRAAGGRMSSQKTSNNDSCRDLTGRRLSTIKEAKKLADYIESEPIRKKAEQEAKKAKLEALEKKLGISKDSDSASTGQKRRFEDTEYLEQSQEIVDNVKSAVKAALLKKRKKAKLNPAPETTTATDIVQTVVESPITAPVAAVAAVVVSSVGA